MLVLVQADDGSSHVHANTILEHVFQTMVSDKRGGIELSSTGDILYYITPL